ncbi:hypothetical protein WME75_03800 [Sorangium sp. So ce1014]|uniref:hypothetical protein n=1 Tax=Sorangium sp. So ce1014 TaxID=3133326 RepID=UPI003F5D755D
MKPPEAMMMTCRMMDCRSFAMMLTAASLIAAPNVAAAQSAAPQEPAASVPVQREIAQAQPGATEGLGMSGTQAGGTGGGAQASAPGTGAPLAETPPAAPEVPRGPAPEDKDKRNWVPVIALGAVSAVALGVGVGATVAGSNVLDDVHAKRQAIRNAGGQCTKPQEAFVDDCADLSSTGGRVDTLGHVAGIAYVASGVLAAAAVTYALWPRADAKTAGRPPLVATAHPTGAGVVLVGAW